MAPLRIDERREAAMPDRVSVPPNDLAIEATADTATAWPAGSGAATRDDHAASGDGHLDDLRVILEEA